MPSQCSFQSLTVMFSFEQSMDAEGVGVGDAAGGVVDGAVQPNRRRPDIAHRATDRRACLIDTPQARPLLAVGRSPQRPRPRMLDDDQKLRWRSDKIVVAVDTGPSGGRSADMPHVLQSVARAQRHNLNTWVLDDSDVGVWPGGCVDDEVGEVDLEDAELVVPGVAEDPEVVAAFLLVVPAGGAEGFEACGPRPRRRRFRGRGASAPCAVLGSSVRWSRMRMSESGSRSRR